jgi:hypothetical protein
MESDRLLLDSAANRRAVVARVLLLVLAAGICLPGLFSRAIAYDEGITLLDTAGNALTGWPTSPQPAGELKPKLYGNPSLSQITLQLRQTDVHPPLYYWVLSFWRQAFGPSLEAARALSLVCSVAVVGLLYCFCVVGGVRHPVIPTLTFALTAASIDQAQQARSYSLALLLLGSMALVALLLWKREPKSEMTRALGFAAVALLGNAAFLTNYLTMFSAAVIIVWLALVIQRGRAALLVITAVVSVATVAPWAPALADQLRSRPGQFTGFRGFPLELVHHLLAYAHNLLMPTQMGDVEHLAFVAGMAAFASLCAIALLRTKSAERPHFLVLVWALALAPSVGLMTLDVLFDKHLVEERYFYFAVPALVVLITHKLGAFRQPLRSLTYLPLGILWLSQLICVNWGYEVAIGRRADRYRSLAKAVEAVGSRSAVLYAGVEFGDGIPASLVCELPASLPVVFVEIDTDAMALASVLDRYEYVWQVYSGGPTGPVEHAVADRLSKLGRTPEPAPGAVLFRRQPGQHE